MAEAIFAKYSKGEQISAATKAIFGLPSTATLDECLATIGMKDSNAGTVQVLLKDIDGTPLGGHKIRMQDPTGYNVSYTTDGSGLALFKTANGQATFYDESNNSYCDVGYPAGVSVDLPVGSVKKIELQRFKKLNNGDSFTFTQNGWANFSKYADTCDVEVRGESGQGGSSGWFWHRNDPGSNNTGTHIQVSLDPNYYNRYWSNVSENGKFYEFWNLSNTIQPYLHVPGINYNSNSGIILALNRGGGGENGSTNTKNFINIKNKNFFLTIPSGKNKNINIYKKMFLNYNAIGLQSIMGSQAVIVHRDLNVPGNNGISGGTTSAFGITANGGRGGGGGGMSTANVGVGIGYGIAEGGQNAIGTVEVRMNTYLNNGSYYFKDFYFNSSLYLETGKQLAGQVTISNFRYK